MRAWLLLLFLTCPLVARADESTKLDPRIPYRTDFANANLPWRQLTPGEFPPQGAEHRVSGELVAADFLRRSGQFRANRTGELVDFKLLPCATVMYLNAEADLRDLPLGTCFVFFLYQDEQGAFTTVATMRDEYTLLAAEGLSYRLDEAKLDQGKLAVTRQTPPAKTEGATDAAPQSDTARQTDAPPRVDGGSAELQVNNQTRVWKGDKQARLSDLAVGDQLLVNLTGGGPDHGGACCDIWVDAETHKLATEQQRKKHVAFLKRRGLAGRIDRVAGKQVTVTLFGDPAGLQALFKDERIDASLWAREHRGVDAVVANEELRTYNPPVDRQRSKVVELQSAATDRYGSSGVRWVIEPNLLLEGFRAGRVIRIFAHPSWPVEDMPFGECLYNEAPQSKNEVEEAVQYPYRTDFANENLPWYQLQPGVFPPVQSQHLVSGDLTKVDPTHRTGQFRADATGELMDFTLLPFATIMYLNAHADIMDIPLTTRCGFYLYQDDHGAFTRAAVVMDEYTRLVRERFTHRLVAARLEEGKLLLATQLDKVRNYKDDWVRPPDVGVGEFSVDEQTRVWKRDQPIKLADLVAGDELLVNLTGRAATSRGRCTDIWVGAETHKLVTDQQNAKHNAFLLEHGFPAWIDHVEGKELAITFFSGPGHEFQGFFHDGPPGGKAFAALVDDNLLPRGVARDAMKFKHGLLDEPPFGIYGSRGAHWRIESERLPEDYRQGQLLRVFKEAKAGG